MADLLSERNNGVYRAKQGKASRNEFVEKGGVPDRIESFREINSSADCLRAWPGFV